MNRKVFWGILRYFSFYYINITIILDTFMFNFDQYYLPGIYKSYILLLFFHSRFLQVVYNRLGDRWDQVRTILLFRWRRSIAHLETHQSFYNQEHKYTSALYPSHKTPERLKFRCTKKFCIFLFLKSKISNNLSYKKWYILNFLIFFWSSIL